MTEIIDSIEARKEALRLAIASLALEGERPSERVLNLLNMLAEKKISFEEAHNIVKDFD
ncbi:antitoxin VbhA family protein [Oligella urethralis]|uniref:antitoxin VbhA family protein n=1 Tax=Oligella urethralis TaxID=90245 RepID=UPI0015F0FBF3|nr:antitoxin VbhA family protein [Oligella urethralis]